MRWYWIDRFTEFVSGQRAVAMKNVSLAEEHLHDYFHSYPIMPSSLIVEGMAQTGGILLGEATHYDVRLVLAKVTKSRFFFPARPGDTLTYTTTIENQIAEGALIRGTSHVGQRLQAEAEFYLAVLGDQHGEQPLFEPGDLARLLRVLRVYEVGRTADGQPLEMPQRLLNMEREARLSRS